MFTALVVALVQGASVVIDPMGFSVVRDGPDLVVDSVEATGPAGRSGLQAGTTILFVKGPAPHTGSELGKLSDDALRELLTPPWFEPLRLQVKPAKGFMTGAMLSRPGLPTAEFWGALPWPPERLAKLTERERSAYEAELKARNPAPLRVFAELRPPTTLVTVTLGSPRVITKMSTGEFDAKQVTWAGTVLAECAPANVARVTVLEPAKLAVPAVVPAPSVKLDVKWPLLGTDEVLAACKTPSTSVLLDRKVKLELVCAGQPPREQTVTATVMVDCLKP